MSLLAELQSRGVTTEDLEKAASVRLFEKAAAAEGVNLDDLREDQVISLFEQFVSAPTSSTKEASAMNDEIVELFEKTAAAEGIDLDEMSDEDLAELYEHYVENVLPGQLDDDLEKDASEEVMDLFQKTAEAEGIDLEELSVRELSDLYDHYVENVLPLQLGDEDAEEKVADAQEKLAEAEILGRHMARAYVSEMGKLAAAPVDPAVERAAAQSAGAAAGRQRILDDLSPERAKMKRLEDKGRLPSTLARLKELATGHMAAEARTQEKASRLVRPSERITVTSADGMDKAKKKFEAASEAHQKRIGRIRMFERAKGYGKRGAILGAVGGVAYGANRMRKQASAEEIEEIAFDRANEFLASGSVSDYDGSFVDDLAMDILRDNGYSW
jgi:hypothetical protein